MSPERGRETSVGINNMNANFKVSHFQGKMITVSTNELKKALILIRRKRKANNTKMQGEK